MDERDKQLLKKFLIGGATAGTAVAGTAGLLDYVKYLKNKADMENNPNSLDNDTIYIDKQIPGVNKSAALNSGVALAGGALTGLASFVAISKMYQLMKKKQLQKDMDAAQSVYTDTFQEKAAADGKSISTPELVGSAMPVGALILAGLASGAITYQSLRKSFPSLADSRKRKDVLDQNPSRVETRYVDEEGNPIKAASVDDLTDDDYAYGMAYAGFMAKNAGDNNDLLSSLFNSVVYDSFDSLEDVVATGDGESLHGFVKAASALEEPELTPNGVALVSTFLAKSAAASTLFTMAVFDTLSEKSLYFIEKAASFDEETLTIMCKIASNMGQGMIKEIPIEVEEEEVVQEQEPVSDGSYVDKIIQIIKDNPEKFVKKTVDVVDKVMA